MTVDGSEALPGSFVHEQGAIGMLEILSDLSAVFDSRLDGEIGITRRLAMFRMALTRIEGMPCLMLYT